MLREDNVRVGFFEPEQYQAVLAHLPDGMQPVVTFAYVTGWRINSEVLPLQWRQMKLSGHETRSVFDGYNVVSDGDVRDASRRLGHTGGHTSPSFAFGGEKSENS